jgi:23S rRNA (cytosine1962-C5)-methyltransferase
MDRALAFPHFEDAWILHVDEDVVVLDKPTGVPTQAADPARPDDVVTRLRAQTQRAYLGVHQRLDRDTSGVLLLTARKEANARIAAAFEGRKVEKRYVACVTGWPAGKAKATLRDRLTPGDDGRMRVAGPREKVGLEAISHVKVLARSKGGDRTMLEVILETGRTHQARVQLAHAGAPIAGDRLYRGAPASRLMLHASELSLPAAGGKAAQKFAAPVPAELHAWLDAGDRGAAVYDDPAALARVVAQAARARYGLAYAGEGDRATTAFRLVNEAGDALPHLAVDVYGTHLVAQLYDDETGPWRDPTRKERVLDALAALGFDGIYLKVRPKQANTLVDTRRDDLAPKAPVRGVAAADPLVIHEEGIPYVVRLGDGLSTGIFLDQRGNRRRVRELAAGGSVVNLFSYTCAFSVAAAVGGAWRTISVDASVAALERGRENMRAAGVLDTAEHSFVAEDAFAWLARQGREKKENKLHDLVLLDPPSYSSTKKRRFVADHDYPELAALALGILRPGGKLLACTNHRGISKHKFRKMLFDAVRKAGKEAASIKDTPEPMDFVPAIGMESHLKSAIVTLSS